MAYISLYRKWRPEVFTDIVGQEHISKTLINAIELGRISHAYLFCGPRGTGKTSTAKVFARALNCVNGPTANPCGECENCQKVKNNNSLNVIEIDAASNRGIDEIRELREKVRFSPSEGRYKVYIIDEVHMLTTEAFNALLKTLEEPPAHVIFVLATTEPHKVLPTILSRCQRFDFRRISIKAMLGRLTEICTYEKIEIDEGALFAIARSADGGMRDALSTLEQCIAYMQTRITATDVYAVLGMVSEDIYPQLAKIVYESNMAESIKLINQLADDGRDILQFIKGALGFFRDVLLIKVSPEILVDMPAERVKLLQEISEKFTIAQLTDFIEQIAEAEGSMKWSSNQVYQAELLVMRLIKLFNGYDTKSIVERLTKLEERLNGLPQGNSVDDMRLAYGKQNLSTNLVDNNSAKVSPASDGRHKSTQIKKDVDEVPVGKLENSEKPAHIDIDTDVKEQWDTILDEVKRKKVSIAALLKEAEPVNFNGSQLLLIFKNEYKFHKENIEKTGNKELVEEVIGRILGGKVRITCLLRDEYLANSGKVQTQQEHNSAPEEDTPKQEEDYLVKRALEVFKGTLIKP